MSKLPQGWVECELKDVCTKITDGSHFSPKTVEKSNYPYVTVKDVNNDEIDFENCKFISKEDYEELVKNGCQPEVNDVLFSKDGTVGKVTLIDYKKDFVILSSLAIIRPNIEIINPQYLKWALKNPEFLQEAINKKTGVAIRRIILRTINCLNIKIPPFNEQKRIVEKIEEEFRKIDEGVEKLKLAQEQVKQYRQSVLKSAFDGKLYKTTEWEEKTLAEIASKISDGSHNPPPKQTNGKVMISGQNIKNNKIIFDDFRFITEEDFLREYKRTPIETNDILLTIVGSIGQSAVVPDDIQDFTLQRSVALIKPLINSYYLKYYLDAPKAQHYFKTRARGTAQKGVYLNTLKELKVVIPSKDEQKQIVKEIEKRFEVADEVERVITENLEKAEQLKQSILKKAFEGRLVPQDPTDQPASELLAQIQTERNK